MTSWDLLEKPKRYRNNELGRTLLYLGDGAEVGVEEALVGKFKGEI